MTATAHVLSPALAKEVRALLPTYGAALIAVVVGSFGDSYILVASGLLGFAFGSVALGAHSFGHEYSNRTLGLLLSQPLDRRRLFVYKLAVLAVMLISLTGTTLVMYQERLRLAASPHTEPRMLVLAAACALFVAPCLTMLCRSTLAGAVFTIAIPGLLSTGADVAGGIIYGLHNAAAIDRFRLVVFWRGIFVICALTAIAGWRMFQRLEVIEGHEHVQFPDSLRVGSTTLPASRRRHPVWMLVWKELRLQQITFVVAGLFTLAWLGLAWLERVQSDSPRLPLISITILSACVLAMLAGALASAEERHLGTAQWQILLPMAAWRQWTVKVGVVWGIVLMLGGGVPAVLGFLIPVREWFTPAMVRQVGAIALLLATGTLYVSSLCRSGIAALSVSFPIAVAAAVVVRIGAEFLFGVLASARLPAEMRQWLSADVLGSLFFAAAGGLIALVLWLAFLNHRTADRSAARTSTQVLGIAGYVAVGLTVLIALGLR